jgi:hypothetical protein
MGASNAPANAVTTLLKRLLAVWLDTDDSTLIAQPHITAQLARRPAISSMGQHWRYAGSAAQEPCTTAPVTESERSQVSVLTPACTALLARCGQRLVFRNTQFAAADARHVHLWFVNMRSACNLHAMCLQPDRVAFLVR